jgi:hypothetical protein
VLFAVASKTIRVSKCWSIREVHPGTFFSRRPAVWNLEIGALTWPGPIATKRNRKDVIAACSDDQRTWAACQACCSIQDITEMDSSGYECSTVFGVRSTHRQPW